MVYGWWSWWLWSVRIGKRVAMASNCFSNEHGWQIFIIVSRLFDHGHYEQRKLTCCFTHLSLASPVEAERRSLSFKFCLARVSAQISRFHTSPPNTIRCSPHLASIFPSKSHKSASRSNSHTPSRLQRASLAYWYDWLLGIPEVRQCCLNQEIRWCSSDWWFLCYWVSAKGMKKE